MHVDLNPQGVVLDSISIDALLKAKFYLLYFYSASWEHSYNGRRYLWFFLYKRLVLSILQLVSFIGINQNPVDTEP